MSENLEDVDNLMKNEYSVDALDCLACGKRLWNVHDDCRNQPGEALSFTTHGAYGTTVFDPDDGHYLEINICDECMREARARKRVYIGRDFRLIMRGGMVMGQEAIPMQKLRLWKDDE